MERYLRYIDVAKKYKSFGPIYVKNKCIYIYIYIYVCVCVYIGFHGGSPVKSPANAGDTGSIPGLESTLEKEMAAHSSIFA